MFRDWLRRRQIARAIVVSDADVILHLAAQANQRGGEQALTGAIQALIADRSDVRHWDRVQSEIARRRQPKAFVPTLRSVLARVPRTGSRPKIGGGAPSADGTQRLASLSRLA